jgi:hypothetical protein
VAHAVVFGCGPAGLFAAQALDLHGFDVVIISKKHKSIIYGAQFLHKPIPHLSSPAADGVVFTHRLGTAAAYAERVYGDATRPTSWGKMRDEIPAWDLRKTYDAAWEKFEGHIVDQAIDASDISEFTAFGKIVVSTIPLWSICINHEHSFDSIPILVKPGLTDNFREESYGYNFMLYNGTKRGLWYRQSSIFEHESIEAVASPQVLAANHGWDIGFKVAGTNCDCHPNLVKTGRMGKWKPGVLTHHAFEDTIAAIADQYGALTGAADED